ncbi:MAG: S1 RNA-binding domain-containing protein [Anaerolineae bacterium]|nr:S1 RNA-binding domain-containing protein [Anaerolineae bacterium]
MDQPTATETEIQDPNTLSDTQLRSDELAAQVSDDVPSAVENINTDDMLTHQDAGELSSNTTATTPKVTKGQLVEGTITATTPTSVTVDLGEGVEGVIPGRELERMSRKMLDGLRAGEKLYVFVVNPNSKDYEGKALLSVNRALEEMDWKQAEQYRASQDVYEGHVAGYNKGGLIVRFGRLRGFVPQSQISEERRQLVESQTEGTPEDRYSKMVNDPISVKVMEVDRARNRLILSERAATREVREKRKEDLIGKLNVGQVLEGRVVSLEDFGAFVDVGGAEGLVHTTEISWKHVNHPKEALRIGETVRVEVISVDPDRKRIGLSMKRQASDPWDEVAISYSKGQLVQATITKLTKFGAFARLVDAPDIEGLIHISELSNQRVNHPREVVKEGEKLTLRVVKILVEERRLGLSLKQVNSAEYLDIDMKNYSSDGDK